MKTSIKEQAAKALKDRGKRKIWLSVMLCLALVVSSGTFYVFMRQGRAKVLTEKVLTCQYTVHEHTEECFGEDGELLCGQADYVLHTHNDDCYGANGELVCTLPELEAHQHTADCYMEREFLVCDHENTEEGHRHTDLCYAQPDFSCGLPEHVHDDACYDENGTLVCGLEEHEHTDACSPAEDENAAEPEPSCGLEETAGGSVHTAECYATESILACGKEEAAPLHTHEAACYDEEGRLICGQLEVLEHVHGPECFEEVKISPDELTWQCGQQAHVHDESCYDETGELVCGLEEHTHTETCAKAEPNWQCGLTAHTHDEACYDADGALVCGLEEHEHSGDCLTVPEPVWQCGREVHVHDASCVDENGVLICGLEEHEHTAECLDGVDPVWLCGKTAHAHGADCYDADGALVCGLEEHTHSDACVTGLDMVWLCGKTVHTHDENCCDSEGNLLCGLEEHQHTEECLELWEVVELNSDYHYATESGLFDITFHVEGSARLPVDNEAENAGVDNEGAENTDVEGENPGDLEDESGLSFTAEPVYEGEGYERFASEAEKLEETLLDVLSIHMSKDGQELDLSQCEVRAEIAPTELLLSSMAGDDAVYAETGGEETATEDTEDAVLRLTACETGEDGVSTMDEIFIEDLANAAGGTQGNEGGEPAQTEEPSGVNTLSVTLNGNAFALYGEVDTNPKFKVEYYAYIDRLVTSENYTDLGATIPSDDMLHLELIDTSAAKNGGNAKLPENGKTPQTIKMYVEGTVQRGNKVTITTDGVIKHKENVLTEIFKSQKFNYFSAPNFTYYDILPPSENKVDDHYELQALWILKENGNPDNEDDWDKHLAETLLTLRFTNNPDAVEKGYILITSDTQIRLVYNMTEDNNYRNDAAFYDYDITDGFIYTQPVRDEANRHNTSEQHYSNPETGVQSMDERGVTQYAYTLKQGINSDGNYGNSSGKAKLGFGNGNTKSGMQDERWGGNLINQANGSSGTNSYNGCAFGLVKDLQNGCVVFADGIVAPNLFNDGRTGVTGKTGFDGSLIFKRRGDTYTLTGVTGTNTVETGLDTLNYTVARWTAPGVAVGSRGYAFSNEFWPMDAASTYGADKHDLKFGSSTLSSKRLFFNSAKNTGTFVVSDHLEDHNAYFGMNFSVNFTLTADYRGPLEYVFYGDDDMWVFLVDHQDNSSKLICDIGGVHSSVGEYVNLKDYLTDKTAEQEVGKEPPLKAGKYTLYFFYTERGAQGSTCWMQFTLPQASTNPVGVDTGDLTNTLQVSKEVVGEVDPDKVFTFQLNLTDKDGNPLPHLYSYTRYDEKGNASYPNEINEPIQHGGTFQLKHKEYIRINNLPVGAKYSFTEVFHDNKEAQSYALEADGPHISVSGSTATGTIEGGSNSSVTEVKLINRYLYKLPETGGVGVWAYVPIAAAAMFVLGALFVWVRRKEN